MSDTTTESDLFVPPPAAPTAIPPRVEGVFFGVDIPEDIPVFDCRLADEHILSEAVRAPWGEHFYNRSLLALGLATGYHNSLAPRPAAIEVSCDTRMPKLAHETAASFARILDHYRRVEKEWNERGGQYKPIAIEVDNYGFTVVGDRNQYKDRVYE